MSSLSARSPASLGRRALVLAITLSCIFFSLACSPRPATTPTNDAISEGARSFRAMYNFQCKKTFNDTRVGGPELSTPLLIQFASGESGLPEDPKTAAVRKPIFDELGAYGATKDPSKK